MKKVVCHGDSLTEAADLDKKYTWPILVENRLSLKIINSGIGGDTSEGHRLMAEKAVELLHSQFHFNHK